MVSNISSNSVAYFLSILGVIVLVAISVTAYGTNNPSVLGHTLDELAPPTGCQSGEILIWTGSSWDCKNMLESNLVATGTDGFFAKYGAGSYLIVSATAIKHDHSQVMVGGTYADPGDDSKLHVYSGDLKATGTICSDTSGCIGDTSPQISTEYTTAASPSNNNSIFLGIHELCFLTDHEASGPNLYSSCEVKKDVDPVWPNFNQWTLYAKVNAVGESITCKARCLS